LVLDKLLRNTNLDFCVFCSSVSALYGEFALVDYSAANAFLDAYALKHASERKIVSINWNMWRDVGMLAHSPAVPAEELRLSIAPEEGKEAFARILGGALPQVVVSPRELVITGYKEREAGSGEPVAKVSPEKRRHPRPKLSTEYVIPGNSTERTIAEMWQELLGVETVGIHDNFFELGGNSALVPGVIGRIRSAFAVGLPATGVIENPTVHLLSEGIRQGRWDGASFEASRSRGQRRREAREMR